MDVDNDHCVTARQVQPQVRYRAKDEQRCRQLDSLHNEVAGKVDAVIESFKTKPAKSEMTGEGMCLTKRQSSTRRIVVGRGSSFSWFFAVLCCAGVGLLVQGWLRVIG